MQQNKLLFIFLSTVFLVLTIPMAVSAIPADLPWDWFDVASNDPYLSIGLGTRDPNLGEQIGLELAAINSDNGVYPNMELLYFFDPSESYSLNVGVGISARDVNSNTTYGITYSSGLWFHLADILVGVGYHSKRGLTLRCSMWF